MQAHHHDYAGTGFVTKLSSAGLVYKHFGKQIVASALSKPQESEDVHTTWLAVYKYFMEAIDGIDNGNLSHYCAWVPKHRLASQHAYLVCIYTVHKAHPYVLIHAKP